MKKISILGLCLLILAGIIVVLFKGFNVNFLLEQHEVIEFTIGKNYEIKDVYSICKEVFGDKEVILRKIELFNDSVSINVSSVTNEEKENLVTKLNEKYGTEKDVADVEVKTVANVRIRDWVKPYIKPIVVSGILILIYMLIIFRGQNVLKFLGKIVVINVITVLALLSVCAICRVAVSPVYIMGFTFVVLFEIMIYTERIKKQEN